MRYRTAIHGLESVECAMELAADDYGEGETLGFPRVIMNCYVRPSRSSGDEYIAVMEEWIASMAADCDRNMTDVTEQDIATALVNGEGGKICEDRLGFSVLDSEIVTILNASGGNHSTKNDTWSRRRFDEWRLQNGMPTSVPIETMNLQDLAKQLPVFFRQVMKHNGDHYPLESLLGFYRGFTRIMQKPQEARICETRVIETPFCMRSHPLFQETGIAFLEAMRRSVLVGANKRRKKHVGISWPNEEVMLADKEYHVSHPYGCFRRWIYFSISRFLICSGKELYNVMDSDFQEQKDENGDCVVYSERRLSDITEASTLTLPASTKGKQPCKRGKVEPIVAPVRCHQGDVIHTYRQFMKHQPVKVGDEVGKSRHLFLQPIGNPVTNAWFAKSHVSERVLISIFKSMAVVAGINVKDICNRPGRPTINTVVCKGDDTKLISAVKTLSSTNGLHNRHGSNVDLQAGADKSTSDKVSESTRAKRDFQEAFRATGRHIKDGQNSFQRSSQNSEQLLGTDYVSNAVVCGDAAMISSENLITSCEQHKEANFDSSAPDHCILTKLQIGRSQLRELESTLFDKISLKGGGTSTTGQNLQDLVHIAMSQLKGLEATLSSLISIS